ncbi:MAG: class I mannose-6-phosphate isomerase [Bacteroidetes bacterium]|jgi:mannose-6-phosphate isomerase|nr:class I mannose-6-phosphate isomerase [Bacteroidota bacterium]MBT6686480.1 class I mannose-6-phosphate isomerase [Bacteroidota bacterium]MBT7142709.1 class I mannose-6-phosphate isomerase [Bacteroidota bacterium]MBT7491161.1 class I mannose-6-phosphate isomerase [Bacteroidota bacterium]
MKNLYPLKFMPILKNKIWGGTKLKTLLNKNISATNNCGESWEISGVENSISVVSNGFLKNKSLTELIEIYNDKLVGKKVYQFFGSEFPLLIKFIDASDVLSIQVHPDDGLAYQRHQSKGKTEMWYIIQADENSELISGFNQEIDKNIYLKHLENKGLGKILNSEKVKSGDVFFIPAGRVHAIGKGILLAEIQQTSDITYRIYDWDRLDKNGDSRELHTELAVDAIDYSFHQNYKSKYETNTNSCSEIESCKYFTCNILKLNKSVEKDITSIDSFVIYMCVEGSGTISCNNQEVNISMGETVLLPASLKNYSISTKTEVRLLEIYL